MGEELEMAPGDMRRVKAESVVIRVESGGSTIRAAGRRLLLAVLTTSLLVNVMLTFVATSDTSGSGGVQSYHHSGTEGADSRLAVISFSGTIMPPFTDRWLRQIEMAIEDDSVKGVLLSVDSPGGLVADSHQIYHELLKLRKKKPIYVAMKRMAASGGYYISMGIGEEGRIFAEPTAWTGSIGVIIPRYNAADLASKIGVTVEPLATGPMKDSLNPFRDLSDDERVVWDLILKDAFDRFIKVIADNRPGLSDPDVRQLATGQIYTTSQALENGLIDEVGFEEDALTALATSLSLSEYEVVEYASPPSMLELILSSEADSSASVVEQIMDASVPRAMYYSSWNPWIPSR